MRVKITGCGRLRMPTIKAEISIGNILSIAISIVTLFSIVVTMSVFSTKLRADVDKHASDITDIKQKLAQQMVVNQQNSEYMAEVRVDLKYMREMLQRIEGRARP